MTNEQATLIPFSPPPLLLFWYFPLASPSVAHLRTSRLGPNGAEPPSLGPVPQRSAVHSLANQLAIARFECWPMARDGNIWNISTDFRWNIWAKEKLLDRSMNRLKCESLLLPIASEFSFIRRPKIRQFAVKDAESDDQLFPKFSKWKGLRTRIMFMSLPIIRFYS